MNVECSWWKHNIDQDREKSEANSIYLSGNTKDIYSMLVKSAFSKNNTRDEGDINLPVEPLAKEKYILPETFPFCTVKMLSPAHRLVDNIYSGAAETKWVAAFL